MRIKSWLLATLLVLCTGALAVAQDTAKKEMSPEEKAMMEAWMKAMTPGDAHKALQPMIGTFNVTVSSWMAPGAPPQVTSGTSENKWVLGNRYIEQRFNGTYAGQPFSGIGYVGYDNVSKKYWSTWIDNMSTGVMTSTGTGSDGKSFSFVGSANDPMSGKAMSFDEKMTFVDNDHQVWEMWGPGPDGKNFKMMEIAYTRKK